MRSYSETLDFLFSQLPMYQRVGKAAFKKDLSNTLEICKVLNNPEDQFKSIHIAGTNGKGSTAHFLASVLQEAGFKTGLYTSPHLKDFRERVRINGKMIPQKEVVDFVEEHLTVFERIKPSFFEWTVALAFDYFAKEQVDFAVIETGLGGRLDSTNVIKPELSVITNIAFDHMEMLGDTLEKIAKEKAGIIKADTPVVIGNSSGVAEVFNKKAEDLSAPIRFAEAIDLQVEIKSPLKGIYQKENLRTVYGAWLELRKLGYPISYPHFQMGIKKVKANTGLRGRWDELQKLPRVIADVAHNEAGLDLIMQQLKAESYKELHIVLGVVKEKDLSKILKLFPINASFYFCAPNVPRALNVEDLKIAANRIGLKGEAYSSVELAKRTAIEKAEKDDLVYIGGSTFVVAEAL